MDPAVQHFFEKGLATSTHKTYQSAIRKFTTFCSLYAINSPFPVSESLLCYFSSYLACQKLSAQTIKTYLAGIRNMQISLGFAEPKEFSSLSRLRRIQMGIQRSQESTPKTRLPITPGILHTLRNYWFQDIGKKEDAHMLWAAATVCFFGFLRSGEITVPSAAAFIPAQHLAWGDVAIDSHSVPTMMKVHLKKIKM